MELRAFAKWTWLLKVLHIAPPVAFAFLMNFLIVWKEIMHFTCKKRIQNAPRRGIKSGLNGSRAFSLCFPSDHRRSPMRRELYAHLKLKTWKFTCYLWRSEWNGAEHKIMLLMINRSISPLIDQILKQFVCLLWRLKPWRWSDGQERTALTQNCWKLFQRLLMFIWSVPLTCFQSDHCVYMHTACWGCRSIHSILCISFANKLNNPPCNHKPFGWILA